nr:polysaccharide deacetylase family protein [uncultured Clostridium sp.]
MKKKRLSIVLLFVIIFNFICSLAVEDVKAADVDASQNKKVIYLTFDDGPSVVTETVLDILKENDVKATFFLIGNQIEGYEDMVRRINKEGHSIGLHSYTHNFKKIYSNKENFIKEMHDSRDEIKKVADVSTNILRFPGGSSKRLNDEMLELLHSCNFKIYDWNMCVSDGIKPKTPPNKLFEEATKGKTKPNPIILLMHCDYMHKNTCKALPMIINYYKKQGYEFRVIDEDTPECYFPYKKAVS